MKEVGFEVNVNGGVIEEFPDKTIEELKEIKKQRMEERYKPKNKGK